MEGAGDFMEKRLTGTTGQNKCRTGESNKYCTLLSVINQTGRVYTKEKDKKSWTSHRIVTLQSSRLFKTVLTV